jgi:hypothetical protein
MVLVLLVHFLGEYSYRSEPIYDLKEYMKRYPSGLKIFHKCLGVFWGSLVSSFVERNQWPTIGLMIGARSQNPRARICRLDWEEAKRYWPPGVQAMEDEDEDEEENEARVNYAEENESETRTEARSETVIKGGEDQSEMRERRAHQFKA